MIKRDLSQGCKDFSVPANQLVWYFTSTNWRIKTYDHLHCHHHQKKSFWQNSTPIYDKTLHKVSIEGTYLNIIKAKYDKTTTKILLSGEKLENISSKIRNKTRVFTFTTIIQHSSWITNYSNQRRKRNKRNPDGKARNKAPTICKWHDTVHRKP